MISSSEEVVPEYNKESPALLSADTETHDISSDAVITLSLNHNGEDEKADNVEKYSRDDDDDTIDNELKEDKCLVLKADAVTKEIEQKAFPIRISKNKRSIKAKVKGRRNYIRCLR